MEKDSLSMLPPEGFDHKTRNFSVEAMAWLHHMKLTLGLDRMRSARHGFEVSVGGHWIDGEGVDSKGHRYLLNYHGDFNLFAK